MTSLWLLQSTFSVNTFVAEFDMQRGQSNGCARLDSISGSLKLRIIPNVAARLAVDVTRCVVELSAPDEMSTLNQLIHLHNDSHVVQSKKKEFP